MTAKKNMVIAEISSKAGRAVIMTGKHGAYEVKFYDSETDIHPMIVTSYHLSHAMELMKSLVDADSDI